MLTLFKQTKDLILVTFMSFFIYGTVGAQGFEGGSSSEQPTIDPSPLLPSPNVMAIEKYGAVPVSYHTGQPNVSFPLFTLQSGSASVPISISHHAQGVKVNDISGEMGVSWALNAGGHFLQIIQGVEDAANSGGFTSTNEIMTAAGDADWQALELLYCQIPDNDVDFYSFSTPTASGKFFYDRNGVPQFMPKQALNVQENYNGYRYFVEDHQGVKYLFSHTDFEEQSPLGTCGGGSLDCYMPTGVTKTHKLSRITSHDFGQIDFEYEDIDYSYLTGYSEVDYVLNNGLGLRKSYCFDGVKTKGKRLKYIKTKEGQIAEFEYSENGGPGLLRKLTIHQVDNQDTILVKEFSFSFKTITHLPANKPFTSNTNYFNGRHLLASFTESGKGKFQFKYHNTMLPPRLSYAQDYWGYYNGKDDNTTLIPDRLPQGNIVTEVQDVADRSADVDFMKHCSLEEIVYPLGGSTRFTYDANSRPWPSENQDSNGCVENIVTQTRTYLLTGGANCNDIRTRNESLTIPASATNLRAYFYTNFNDPDRQVSPPPFACSDGDGGSAPQPYIIARIRDSAGDIIGAFYDNDAPDVFMEDRSGTLSIELEAAGTIPQHFKYNPEDGEGPIEIRLVFQWQETQLDCPEPGQTVMQTLGGLRLRSQVDDPGVNGNASGKPIKKKYSYSGAVYQLPQFHKKVGGWYETAPNTCPEPVTDPISSYTSSSVIPSDNMFGTGIAYNHVTETLGDLVIIDTCNDVLVDEDGLIQLPTDCEDVVVMAPLGKIVYTFENEPDAIVFDPVFKFGSTVSKEHLRGILKTKRVYGYDVKKANYYLKSYENNTYQLDNTSPVYYGIKVARLRTQFFTEAMCAITHPEYDYVHFPRQSLRYELQSKTEDVYYYDAQGNQIGEVRTSTTYDYNATNLLPELVHVSRPGVVDVTTTTYNTSVGLGVVAEQDTERSLGEGYFPYQNVAFTYTGNLVTGVSKSSNGVTLESYEMDYDASKRLIKVSNLINETATRYFYSSSRREINGKCENCEVYYQHYNFENSGTTDSNAKAGKKVHNLGTGSVSVVIPDGCKATYWKKPNINGAWSKVEITASGTHVISGSGYIDNVNVYPKDGLFTNYSTELGKGITSILDHNGQTIWYEYDTYGRLIRQLDNDKNVLNEYQYHIINFN